MRPRTNWAGNIAFGAPEFRRPATVGELQAIVAGAAKVRVLGTGHSFNDMADSPGVQVSLAGLPAEADVDSAASLVRVSAAMSYAELATRLDGRGFALRNLASLPHISVAGACATGTHGSGRANQSLAAAVAAMEIVTAEGDIVTIGPRDDSFPGAVVHLGALGAVTRLTLAIVPAFEVSQRVYEDLPLEALDDHFAEIMSAAYSVSLFTDWRAPRLTQIWFKQRPGDPGPPGASWFTARPAPAPRNPVPGQPPANCTEQLGVPGPWYARLPHFRPEFTPSAGDELQSEYLLPAGHAVPALHALREIGHLIAPVLQICEVRRIAADQLWLSPCYRRDTVAFHFTWLADTPRVLPVVRQVEQQLAPFAPRPHWGKVFIPSPETLRSAYDRLPDFLALLHRYDPAAKFRNPYTTRHLPARDLPRDNPGRPASAGGGQQVAAVALGPAPGPGGLVGDHAPVVGEALVAGGGGLGDDRVRPVVVGHDRLGHPPSAGPGQAAGVQEDAEPVQRAALPAVGDVPVVLQRRPVAGGGGEVPGGAAGTGPVEVDERDRPAVAEHQVGGVHVVVADQAGPELGRDRPGPPVSRRVEGRRGEVVTAQQVRHAHQGGVGERVLGQGRDRGLAVHVGQHLGGGGGRQHAGGAVEAGRAQVGQQGVGGPPAGRDGPDHGVADAHDQPAVGGAARQGPRLSAGP
jgi:xylitol oxidase